MELSDSTLYALRSVEISRWEEALIDETLSNVFHAVPLYVDNPGGSLTYGELTWKSLKHLLVVIDSHFSNNQNSSSNHKKCFVDFGSGFGRVLLGVACIDHGLNFNEMYGVEINMNMHKEALNSLSKLKQHPIGLALLNDSLIHFICANGLKEGCHLLWHLDTCDVLYICCTCFDDILLNALSVLVEKYLKTDALVVTTTKRLNSKSLVNISNFSAECTWGHASIYIDRKISNV